MLKFICYPKCTTCQKAKKPFVMSEQALRLVLIGVKKSMPIISAETTKTIKSNDLYL